MPRWIARWVAVGALSLGLISAAHGQAGKEQLYTFRVPIHLKQLSPDLTYVSLQCYAQLSGHMAPNVNPGTTHDMRVTNAQLDTVIVARLQVVVPPQDVGTPGKYYCDLFGRTTPNGLNITLSPDADAVAFRLTPAVKQISADFVW